MQHIARMIGITLLLALGACTQSRWDKPNTNPEAASADLTECRRAAQQHAYRQTVGYGTYPFYSSGRYGSVYDDFGWRGDDQQWAINERFYLQNRLTDKCMRGKGYDRVPVQQS